MRIHFVQLDFYSILKQVYNSYILVVALEVLPVIVFISVMFTLKMT